MPHTVSGWLALAAHELAQAGVPSASLDAELLACHVLGVQRAWLRAHGEQLLTPGRQSRLSSMLERRKAREPIAYLLGYKEFYSRRFMVTRSTLIPRPESEDVVGLLARLRPAPGDNLLDIGTGTGCLGITAGLEFPGLRVTLTDISSRALAVAVRNATSLGVTVVTYRANLLRTPPPAPVRFMVANLPYVDTTWQRSPETDFEPPKALFASHGGLGLIRALIRQAPAHILPGGHLLLEADPCQHADIIATATHYGFAKKALQGYILALQLW
jgi:release factor glutamine methyltransferase